MELLSHASHHSIDLKNQQLRQRLSELEIKNIKKKQKFSEILSERKITNASETARLTPEPCEMKFYYADKQSDFASDRSKDIFGVCFRNILSPLI